MRNRTTSRLTFALAGAAFCLPVLLASAGAPAAQAQQAARTIEGRVLDAGTTPLPGGIVYLQDQKTNIIKRFGQLPVSTDYKIWADYKGTKSKERIVSSFETKQTVTLDFHIGK